MLECNHHISLKHALLCAARGTFHVSDKTSVQVYTHRQYVVCCTYNMFVKNGPSNVHLANFATCETTRCRFLLTQIACGCIIFVTDCCY